MTNLTKILSTEILIIYSNLKKMELKINNRENNILIYTLKNYEN